MKGSSSALLAAAAAIGVGYLSIFGRGFDGENLTSTFRSLSEKLGFWAIPAYVVAHTVTLALCLPCAVLFEAGASVLFGFLPAVACVFSAKLLAASLCFSIGRWIFKRSDSAMEWATKSKYFHVVARGVERDGWRFVLLARFSPLPSYVINYALAATEVAFFRDFLLPTALGCLPMILQNTSIGSLATAAVSESSSSSSSGRWSSYLFPMLGIASSVLISLRIKRYSSDLSVVLAKDKDEDKDEDKDPLRSASSINGDGESRKN